MKDVAKESPKGLEDRDRRQFKRWEVFIRCTVEWGDTIIRGLIANLSYGGALITQVDAVPPEGALVVVRSQVETKKVELERRLTSRMVHTTQEIIEDGQVGSFGVEFQQSAEEVSKLIHPWVNSFRRAGTPGRWLSLFSPQ